MNPKKSRPISGDYEYQQTIWTPSDDPARHPSSRRFHRLLREMGELHDRKQADYGKADDPFANVRDGATEVGLDPWIGAVIRMGDKMRRLQAAARGQNLVNESIRDSFIDLSVYSIIGLLLHEEQNESL